VVGANKVGMLNEAGCFVRLFLHFVFFWSFFACDLQPLCIVYLLMVGSLWWVERDMRNQELGLGEGLEGVGGRECVFVWSTVALNYPLICNPLRDMK
jgi:hypothetical protein